MQVKGLVQGLLGGKDSGNIRSIHGRNRYMQVRLSWIFNTRFVSLKGTCGEGLCREILVSSGTKTSYKRTEWIRSHEQKIHLYSWDQGL